MSNRTGTTRFTTRRGYLLDRSAWSLGSLAVVTAIFVNEAYKWPLTIGLAVVALGCGWLAGKLEKSARAKKAITVDEKGNAVKKVL